MATKADDKSRVKTAEELHAERQEAQQQSVEELEQNPVDYPPTPTQAENDAAKLGIPPVPPEPPATRKKADEADKPGSYTTRDTTAAAKK